MPRCQSQRGGKLSAIGKLTGITESDDERCGDHWADAAQLLKANGGRLVCRDRSDLAVERVEWTVPALMADLAAAPDDPTRKYRAVFAEGKGVAWDKAQSYNAERHIETTTVAQWIKQHLR